MTSVLAAVAVLACGCTSSGVLVATRYSPAPKVPWCPDDAAAAETNEFVAGCARMLEFATESRRQREPVWCWAACAEMIHRYYGSPVTQEELAERIHGATAEGANVEAASYHEIMLALNPDMDADAVAQLRDRVVAGQRFTVGLNAASYASALVDRASAVNSDVMIAELQRGDPVAVVLTEDPSSPLEHAYVLYRVGYAVRNPMIPAARLEAIQQGMAEAGLADAPASRWDWQKSLDDSLTPRFYGVRWVELIDPYNGEPVRLDGPAFRDRIRFMISKARARSILENESKLLEVR